MNGEQADLFATMIKSIINGLFGDRQRKCRLLQNMIDFRLSQKHNAGGCCCCCWLLCLLMMMMMMMSCKSSHSIKGKRHFQCCKKMFSFSFPSSVNPTWCRHPSRVIVTHQKHTGHLPPLFV